MKREERIREMMGALSLLAQKGEPESSFVIFDNPETKKFVQLSPSKGGLLCDIPLIELTRDEEDRIKQVVEEREAAIDEATGELISYQRRFNLNEIGRAAEVVERIFIEVFRLPESYRLRHELGL